MNHVVTAFSRVCAGCTASRGKAALMNSANIMVFKTAHARLDMKEAVNPSRRMAKTIPMETAKTYAIWGTTRLRKLPLRRRLDVTEKLLFAPMIFAQIALRWMLNPAMENANDLNEYEKFVDT